MGGWVVHTVMGWAGQIVRGQFANWDNAVLQAGCTGAEREGFIEWSRKWDSLAQAWNHLESHKG